MIATRRMAKFLRYRRLVCRRADRVAVCRLDPHLRYAGQSRIGPSWPRFCDSHHRSFRNRAAVVGDPERSLAGNQRRRRFLGHDWADRRSLRPDCGLAHAGANCLPASVRRLVVSCPSCRSRRTSHWQGRPTRLAPAHARLCLPSLQRLCCCSSSASITPGTLSPTTCSTPCRSRRTLSRIHSAARQPRAQLAIRESTSQNSCRLYRGSRL